MCFITGQIANETDILWIAPPAWCEYVSPGASIIYSFYKYNLISFYHFFPNPIRHLYLYNIEDHSCKEAKDLAVAFLRYALIEQRHL